MRWPVLSLAATMLALAGSTAPAWSQARDAWAAARIERVANARVPRGAAFRDQTGKRVRFARYLGGKPVILAPVYYECPDICGLTLSRLFAALDGLKSGRVGRDFRVVAYSIDPREGPAAARRVLNRNAKPRWGDRPPPGIHFLTGGDGARAVSAALGFRYRWDAKTERYAHPASIAVLAPDGRLVRWINNYDYDAEVLGASLARARRGGTMEAVGRALLTCFGLDPQSGSRTALIWNLMRGLTLASVMGVALVLLVRRRKRKGRT